MAELAGVPGLTLPDAQQLPGIAPLDLGPMADRGIGEYPARATGPDYPCRVSTIDRAGNEAGGLRMPDVEVPVASHTGFNVRHASTGGVRFR